MVDLSPPTLNSISGISDATPELGDTVTFTVLAADNTGGDGLDDVRLFYQGSNSTDPMSWSITPWFSADEKTATRFIDRDIQPGDYSFLKLRLQIWHSQVTKRLICPMVPSRPELRMSKTFRKCFWANDGCG
jgi:hypothetical protein